MPTGYAWQTPRGLFKTFAKGAPKTFTIFSFFFYMYNDFLYVFSLATTIPLKAPVIFMTEKPKRRLRLDDAAGTRLTYFMLKKFNVSPSSSYIWFLMLYTFGIYPSRKLLYWLSRWLYLGHLNRREPATGGKKKK